jgi:hypothetical protein
MEVPRRRTLLAGAAAVAVLVGGGIAVALVSRHSAPSRPAEPVVAVVHTGADPGERPNIAAVTRLLTGLPAAFAAGRTDGLTASAVTQFGNVRAALPAGSRVAVHADTWRRSGTLGSVAVTVTAPHATAQSFVVVLARQPDGWKVASTQAA